MKKLLTAFGALLLSMTGAHAADCLKIGVASGLLWTGPISRITEVIFDNASLCAEIVNLPQDRLNSLVENGTLDGEALRLNSPVDRRDYLMPVPTPVTHIVGNLYWPKDSPQPRGAKSSVGVMAGQYWPRKAAQDLGVQAIEVSSYEQMLYLTRSGRLQGFVMAEGAFRHFRGSDPDLPQYNVRTMTEVPLFLVVNKRDSALVPALDAQIIALLNNGFIERQLKQVEQ